MALQGSDMERRFSLLSGCVQVFLEHGEAPSDVVPVLLDAAAFAREKQCHALLIISGVDDPATAPALCDAILAIGRLKSPMPRRIAFVAYQYPQYDAYHFAAAFAPNHGIEARTFVSEADARGWLGIRS